MALNPETMTYKDAAAHLRRARTASLASTSLSIAQDATKVESEILDLIEANDFWQNARRYVGPMPVPGAGYAAAMTTIKRSFAPILKLREVLRRHVRGVLGREPLFELVLPEVTAPRRERRKLENYKASRTASDVLADEVDELQGQVWDERGEHKTAVAFVRRLRATGRAYFRYDVPPGLVVEGLDRETGEETQGVSAETWKEAYRLMHLELVPRGAGAIHTDPSTLKKIAFYSYAEDVEGSAGSTKKRRCVQISWLDENDITQVRIVREDNTSDEWSLDTGGELLLIEANMEPLLTPDLLQLQDIVCSIGTMVKFNDDVAGFPEKTAVDVAKPAISIDDPNNPGQKLRVETAVQAGPRTMQYLYSYQDRDPDTGKALLDDQGRPVVRQGTIHYRQPVDSSALWTDIEKFELQIYRAVSQGHIPARTSADASGAMLVELRADYADSLMETQPDVERALRSVCKARLCVAAFLAGDQATLAQFKEARMRVDCDLNAGPLSVEEREEILVRYEKKLLSRQTAMILLGSKDIDSELAQLKEEQREAAGDGVPVVKAKVPPVKPAQPVEVSE